MPSRAARTTRKTRTLDRELQVSPRLVMLRERVEGVRGEEEANFPSIEFISSSSSSFWRSEIVEQKMELDLGSGEEAFFHRLFWLRRDLSL